MSEDAKLLLLDAATIAPVVRLTTVRVATARVAAWRGRQRAILRLAGFPAGLSGRSDGQP